MRRYKARPRFRPRRAVSAPLPSAAPANILIMPTLDKQQRRLPADHDAGDALPVRADPDRAGASAHILTPGRERAATNITAVAAVEAPERAGRSSRPCSARIPVHSDSRPGILPFRSGTFSSREPLPVFA